jgi:hypothetical protein
MEGEVIMSRSAFQPVPISNTGQFSHKESTGAFMNHLDLAFSESLKMLSLGNAKLGFRAKIA